MPKSAASNRAVPPVASPPTKAPPGEPPEDVCFHFKGWTGPRSPRGGRNECDRYSKRAPDRSQAEALQRSEGFSPARGGQAGGQLRVWPELMVTLREGDNQPGPHGERQFVHWDGFSWGMEAWSGQRSDAQAPVDLREESCA